jgi:hypothetical protein
MERGKRLMHQLLKLQSDLGYFNEGPHHGPAMKYNQVQLAAMLLFYDYSKDPTALAGCKRLADFMIRYSFPDGSPIGALDGRQSYSLGFYGTLCYGLDRWPQGKELNRRIYRTRKKWDILDVKSPYYNFSEWYAYFGIFFMLDEYLSLRPDAPTASLPQDENGYRMVESGPSFSGGAIRQHDWMVALSAIASDVPRYRGGPYQLERQSRLDIWHERAGLIIGGGPNMVRADVPLANFLLLTGHKGVDADFGLLKGEEMRDRQAVYFPRNVEASLDLDTQTLEANFGHGDFFFVVKPLSKKRLEVNYKYDIVAAKKAFVQLPVILFHDSKVLVDGSVYDKSSSVKVGREILIDSPRMGSAVRISVPPRKDIWMRRPIYPLRWYGGDHRNQRYKPYYEIALVSVRIEPPAGKGEGRFSLEVQ